MTNALHPFTLTDGCYFFSLSVNSFVLFLLPLFLLSFSVGISAAPAGGEMSLEPGSRGDLGRGKYTSSVADKPLTSHHVAQ